MWGKVVSIMFIGEYIHNLDDKNRLMIPAKFREDLSEEFVITKGLDGCLALYTNEAWNKLTEKLNTLPFTKKDARNFMRFIASGANILSFDKQGRIIITNNLKEHASLEKECVIIGTIDKIEIWSKTNWDKFNDDNKEQFEIIAEHLFDGESGE